MPRIPLDIGNAEPPDGSASNLAPAFQARKSSASAPTPYWLEAWFDAGQTEQLTWLREIPADYASGLTMKGIYKMASATSGNLRLEGRVGAYTVGTDTDDYDAKDFDAANNVTEGVPGTAGILGEFSITLTNADSLAAGDIALVYFARLGGDGADTATGDMELVKLWLEYA